MMKLQAWWWCVMTLMMPYYACSDDDDGKLWRKFDDLDDDDDIRPMTVFQQKPSIDILLWLIWATHSTINYYSVMELFISHSLGDNLISSQLTDDVRHDILRCLRLIVNVEMMTLSNDTLLWWHISDDWYMCIDCDDWWYSIIDIIGKLPNYFPRLDDRGNYIIDLCIRHYIHSQKWNLGRHMLTMVFPNCHW